MPPNDKEPAYWFKAASHDEAGAEILYRENGPPEIAAYHFHQAAEKLIKGAILRSGGTFPYIHDLQRLYGILLALNSDIVDISESIVELQAIYADLRYPRGDFIDSAVLRIIRAHFLIIKRALLPESGAVGTDQ